MNLIRIFRCGKCNKKYAQALVMLQGRMTELCPACGESKNIKIIAGDLNPDNPADKAIIDRIIAKNKNTTQRFE